MKICFLSDPQYLHTQRWARYFQNRGHEVCIIGGEDAEPIPLQGIQVYAFSKHQFGRPWTFSTTMVLGRLLKDIKPDILHMHFLGALIAPVLLNFKPFIVSVWGAEIVGETGLVRDNYKEALIKRVILRRADAVIALSNFLAKATRQYARLPHDRVSVYYWGVDLHRFQPSPPHARDSIVIGFVKHLLPKYGAEYLIRAIPIVQRRYPQIKTLIVGDGPLRSALETLAADLGIADIVRFCGWIPYDQIPNYMAQIDIFVMPSVYESETFGVAAIEAQAMGIPVVATSVGGIPEAVADGVTGILVPPRDPEAIAQAILQLIEHRDLRESMSREGPRFVARHYDWEKNAALVEDLYQSFVARYSRR